MKTFVGVTALWAFLPTVTLAATFTAVGVSGYNAAGIVPSTAVPPYSGTAQSLDASNDALFQFGLPATTAGGLPVSGVLTYVNGATTYTFGLGPYGGSNLLQIPANSSGLFTLATAASYPGIAILGFTTGNNAPGSLEMKGDVTLNFTDGSSSTYSKAVDLSDWFAAMPQNLNVVNSATGGLVNITAGTAAGAFEATSGGPNFYVSVVTLTVGDAAKTLKSVGFGNFPFGGTGTQFIMAISGLTPASPTPTPTPTPTPLGPTPTPVSLAAPALSEGRFVVLGLLLIGAAIVALRRMS
jgi:hypothetical protein